MRGSQCLVQLIEVATVVLAFQVTLDVHQDLFDSLQSGVEVGQLILCSHLLEEFRVSILALGDESAEISDHIGAGMVEEFQTGTEINQLFWCCLGIRRRATCVVRVLLDDGLLITSLLLLLLDWSARLAGLQNKLEDFERVRVFRGRCCQTKKVSRR